MFPEPHPVNKTTVVYKYLFLGLWTAIHVYFHVFRCQSCRSLEQHSFPCDLVPYDLTVEHLSQRDLVTIDPEWPRAPRFSFKASSKTTPSPEAKASQIQLIRFQRQDSQAKEVIWDSGWVTAGRHNGLDITRSRPFDDLVPMERLFWRARFGIEGAKNQDIQACPWSRYDSLLVGPSQAQWMQADWICAPNEIQTDCDFYDTHGKAAAPIFRTEFDIGEGLTGNTTSMSLETTIASARLFVTGLGYYEAWMNGVQINQERFLDPAPSTYSKRVYYNSFDVTNMLIEGRRQALGFLVGNGWFNPLPMKFWGHINLRDTLIVGTPRVKSILRIEFEDRTREPLLVITSMTTRNTVTWETTHSSLLRNDLYLGNIVDLDRSRWLQGWSEVGFESPGITFRSVQTCSDTVELPQPEPQTIPPIRSRPPHTLFPISRSMINNDLVLDMGLNSAAVVNVTIFVPHDWVCSAQQINLKFGELLHPNGTVNVYTSVA